MTQSQVARLFRSPELRDLAVLATHQGWEVARRDGGHIGATNPRTGAMVVLSGTGYVTHGTLAAKRSEFARAGLDLDWTRKGARRHRQEDRRVQVHDVPRAAHVPQGDPVPVQVRNQPRPAGGKFALVGALESLEVNGYPVKVGHRADGTWLGYTRDLGLRARRRTWYGQERDALLAHIGEDLAERPPVRDLPAEVPAPEPVAPSPEGRLDRVLEIARPAPPQGFHIVQADPDEFPLAAALDALESAVGPAVAALRAAGKADAADLLSVEGGPANAIERELLALYRRVLRGE